WAALPSTRIEKDPPTAGSAFLAKLMAASVAFFGLPSSAISATTSACGMSEHLGDGHELLDELGNVFDFHAGRARGGFLELEHLGGERDAGGELGQRLRVERLLFRRHDRGERREAHAVAVLVRGLGVR